MCLMMCADVHVVKRRGLTPSRILELAEVTGDRYVLADRNLVILSIDDYEDMLFLSDERVQKEVAEDMRVYEKTGGIDYLGYRRKRMLKGASDVSD
jgi:hypothetical protein